MDNDDHWNQWMPIKTTTGVSKKSAPPCVGCRYRPGFRVPLSQCYQPRRPRHSCHLVTLGDGLWDMAESQDKDWVPECAHAGHICPHPPLQPATPLCSSFTSFLQTFFPFDSHMLAPTFGILSPLPFTKLIHSSSLTLTISSLEKPSMTLDSVWSPLLDHF